MVTLKEYLNSDRIDYFPFGSKGYIMDWLLRTEQYWIRRYIRALRKEAFYMNYKRNKILQYYFSRKTNLLGIRLGFFINAGCFDIGLKIYHYGSIIVNPKARIGKNCTIHGNCCIGSKGKTVLCAFLPATVCPGCDDDLEIGSNRTADSTFAIVIAVAGGRDVRYVLRICVGFAI